MTGRELYERWCGWQSDDYRFLRAEYRERWSYSQSSFNARLKIQSLLRWRDGRWSVMATDALLHA